MPGCFVRRMQTPSLKLCFAIRPAKVEGKSAALRHKAAAL
jgi:hypothetical protein